MTNREKLGTAALVICGLAGLVWFLRPKDSTAALVFLRAGLILGAIWLAWPDLQRIPRWLSIGSVVSLIVVARFPMLATIIVPAFIVARWALKGRSPLEVMARPSPHRSKDKGGARRPAEKQ